MNHEEQLKWAVSKVLTLFLANKIDLFVGLVERGDFNFRHAEESKTIKLIF